MWDMDLVASEKHGASIVTVPPAQPVYIRSMYTNSCYINSVVSLQHAWGLVSHCRWSSGRSSVA